MGFGTKHFGILFGKVSVLNGELVECYMRHLYVSATRGTGYGFARVQGLHRVLFANGSLQAVGGGAAGAPSFYNSVCTESGSCGLPLTYTFMKSNILIKSWCCYGTWVCFTFRKDFGLVVSIIFLSVNQTFTCSYCYQKI